MDDVSSISINTALISVTDSNASTIKRSFEESKEEIPQNVLNDLSY